MPVDSDLCPLIFLGMILVALGRLVVAHNRVLEAAGLRIAGVVALIRGCTELLSPTSRPDILALGVVSILTGFLLLGPVWICLSVLSSFYGRWNTAIGAWRDRREESRRLRAAESAARLRLEEARLAAIEWERGQPGRDAERLRQEELVNVARACQRRRDDIRARCELVYDRLADRIGQFYPRSKLEDFLQRYMSDARPAEEVEARGRELEQLLTHLLESVEPSPRNPSLDELARWHSAQKAKIESLPLDKQMIDYQLTQLNERYVELIDKLLSESQPDSSHSSPQSNGHQETA